MAGATLGASAVFATSAQAAGNTFTVTSAGDGPANALNCPGPNCTLRDAIAAANADGGGDTINFDSSLANQTITLSNGALDITTPGNTIDGSNASGLAVSGNNSSGVFLNDATSGTTTIENLTAENGSNEFGGAIGVSSYGSGGAALTLSGVTAKDSNALFGGGVFINRGQLKISSSQITGNSAEFGGGVSSKYGTSISNSTVSGNSAFYGGGIFAFHSISVSGSQITGNTLPASDTNGRGVGGGIDSKYNGPLSVSNTTVSGNTSGYGGGIIIDTRNGATVSNSTVSGNTATFSAGGIEVDAYGSSVASGPVARQRAAWRAAAEKRLSVKLPQAPAAPPTPNTGGPVLVSQSTISGNNAADGQAGGIWDYYQSANSPVTVRASTVSGNTAKSNETAGSFGGGILLGGDSNYTTPSSFQSLLSGFQLIDSTVAGNTADHGGGVSVGYDNGVTLLGKNGSVGFNNSTIASNAANLTDGGGGIYLSDYMSGSPAAENSATATISSTVVARDTAKGAGNDLARNPASTSGGFNAFYSLIQNPGNAPLPRSQALITGVDPQLGALANNGGPTETMLPTFTSPVIDQGQNTVDQSTGQPLGSDQRGDPRTVNNGKPEPPGGDGTDIGSVELAQIPITAIIEPATGITAWQATLNGQIQTNAQAVTWHFQYGTTTAYGQVTPSARSRPSGSIGAGNGQVPVSFTVNGLTPHTRYHYRLVGVAANGFTSTSLDATFVTLTPTINTQPHKVKSGKQVRLFGFAGGCTVGARVTLFSRVFAGHHPVSTTVQSGGSYSVKTKIPKGRKGGLYKITASCAGNSFDVTAHLRVVHPKAKAAKKPVRVIRFTG